MMLVCSIMNNKFLPSPWQALAIPRSFSEVISVDSVSTQIYGPFSVAFEYRDDSFLNPEIVWSEHSGEYALYLEYSKKMKKRLGVGIAIDVTIFYQTTQLLFKIMFLILYAIQKMDDLSTYLSSR